MILILAVISRKWGNHEVQLFLKALLRKCKRHSPCVEYTENNSLKATSLRNPHVSIQVSAHPDVTARVISTSTTNMQIHIDFAHEFLIGYNADND